MVVEEQFALNLLHGGSAILDPKYVHDSMTLSRAGIHGYFFKDERETRTGSGVWELFNNFEITGFSGAASVDSIPLSSKVKIPDGASAEVITCAFSLFGLLPTSPSGRETGKGNYEKFNSLGIDFVKHPHLMALKETAASARSATKK